MKQFRPFVPGKVRHNLFEGIENRIMRAEQFAGRKIACEHAPVHAEGVDRVQDIGVYRPGDLMTVAAAGTSHGKGALIANVSGSHAVSFFSELRSWNRRSDIRFEFIMVSAIGNGAGMRFAARSPVPYPMPLAVACRGAREILSLFIR
ncbi:hypothetical protein AruPA_10430 [Acidiphilium sp. PA]|nr:hypothetical protein [Acidiphilium sp. PA]MCW8307453.1 hypothetical protein [Acidiphilium sp. PA]